MIFLSIPLNEKIYTYLQVIHVTALEYPPEAAVKVSFTTDNNFAYDWDMNNAHLFFLLTDGLHNY